MPRALVAAAVIVAVAAYIWVRDISLAIRVLDSVLMAAFIVLATPLVRWLRP